MGKVKEIDIDPVGMFPIPGQWPSSASGVVSNAGDREAPEESEVEVEVGLHVFHVEKFEKPPPPPAIETETSVSASKISTDSFGVATASTRSAAGLLAQPRRSFAKVAVQEAWERAKRKSRWRLCGLSGEFFPCPSYASFDLLWYLSVLCCAPN